MSNKMKGLLKGLRYISQIFDEEKEQEMQIGLPTDVKHVAHIGFDGPAVQESPSWMKEFNSTSTGFSAPLGLPGDTKDNPDITWVSEDSKRGQRSKKSQGKDEAEVPKSSRRQSSTENNSNESPRKKDPSSKVRQSRRKEVKDSSESGPQESGSVGPDVPRRPRRKKSKELVNEGGSRRSRNRATTSNGPDQNDPDPQKLISQLSSIPSVDDQVRESRVTFKE
ncbi:hypothetical protein ACS0TY_013057 [Phlomoides rotata]